MICHCDCDCATCRGGANAPTTKAGAYKAAMQIVSQWDGCSEAELILDLLVGLGEDVRDTLQEADYKYTRKLYPIDKPVS